MIARADGARALQKGCFSEGELDKNPQGTPDMALSW